jgi:tRNA G46 methylase TrmB
VIDHAGLPSVLKVGFGHSLNLALLAGNFPDIGFAGIEIARVAGIYTLHY